MPAAQTRLYSRTGDDISASFPDVASAFAMPAVLDGELLVRGEAQGAEAHGGAAASFNALQQRLGRKNVSAKMQGQYPAFVRLYDILFDGERGSARRCPGPSGGRGSKPSSARLDPDRFDLSRLIEARASRRLRKCALGVRGEGVEGMMLKRRDSPYVGGRRAGLWYKWKRDPLTADCVLMYAQRGSGKRSSYYSDYTFGCWTEGGELLPVGKAYFGFTDEELKWLDRFVCATIPSIASGRSARSSKSLVLEVAFDSIHRSTRHKSGLAMRFPRISRIRTDKPAHEADRIDDAAGACHLNATALGCGRPTGEEIHVPFDAFVAALLASPAAACRNLRHPGRPADRRRRQPRTRALDRHRREWPHRADRRRCTAPAGATVVDQRGRRSCPA